MSCPNPACGKQDVIKGVTGAWFLQLGEETAQITYCPHCGVCLDEVAATIRRHRGSGKTGMVMEYEKLSKQLESMCKEPLLVAGEEIEPGMIITQEAIDSMTTNQPKTDEDSIAARICELERELDDLRKQERL